MSCKAYLSGLSPDADERWVRDLLGELCLSEPEDDSSVVVKRSASSTFAFVQFGTREDAEDAIKKINGERKSCSDKDRSASVAPDKKSFLESPPQNPWSPKDLNEAAAEIFPKYQTSLPWRTIWSLVEVPVVQSVPPLG